MTLRAAEALLGLSLLLVFFSVRDLPLVDLPQHALQITSWMRLDAHDQALSNLELNFRTPYFLCYPIVRLLANVMPVVAALKLTLWASIYAQARVLRALCGRLGHDPWLGLLGFPLGFGYGFCFGFVAFCVALPVVYLAMLVALDHRARPRWQSGVGLGALLACLLVAHGVALGFSMAVLCPLLGWGEGKAWQRLLPLLSPALLGAIWLAPGGTATRIGGDSWDLRPDRILDLPAHLVGISAADSASTLLGSVLLLGVAFNLGAPRSWPLTLPCLVALLGYLGFPTLFRGVGMLQPRFAAYVVPTLLIAFAPRALPTAQRAITAALSFGVACAVLALFAQRLQTFNQETADFYALTARLASGLAVRPLIFERASRAFPGSPAHLHVPAYYTVEKGGSPGYSFAMYSTSVVRYRPGAVIRMGGGAEWTPERFDAKGEAESYDYFIVRSAVDRTGSLFTGPNPEAVLDQHVGDWWGYRRVPGAHAANF